MENEAAYARVSAHFQNNPSMVFSVLQKQKAVEFLSKDIKLPMPIQRLR